MNPKKRCLAIFICLMLIVTLLPCQVFASDGPVTVTIFTTNDIHGVMDGDGTVGVVQAAAMKGSTPHALLVDAGDATQGASFATVSRGEDVIRMMNAAGYDVMAAGNHEFDYGTDQLLANAAAADFPILSANVTLDGKALLPGSTVVEVADKSIGFIGLTTVNTATSTNPSKLTGVSFGEEAKAAKEKIALLTGKTDAIVIICHLGNDASAVDCTSKDLLDALSKEELSAVAAVIDGHSHTLEQETYERDGASIPVVQTGTMFTSIGKIELTFDGDAVAAAGIVLSAEEANSYPLTESGQTVAAQVQATLDAIKTEQAEILGETLCENETPLWGGYIYWDYAETRVVETSYGDFVTDAFAEYAKTFSAQNGLSLPIVALENGGGISATLPMGQVTRGDVLNAFNHGNMVEVLEITPALLKTALESGLTATGQDETGLLLRERVSGSFMQISGFTYTYDPSTSSGNKVVDILLNNGTSLDLSDTQTKLLLATNSYVGASIASIGGAKLGELGGEDQIVMEYIQSLTEGGKALHYDSGAERIKIAGDRSPDTYTVTIPVLYGETPQANVTVHLRVDGAEAEELTTDEDGNLVIEVPRGAHTFYLEESADGQPVYTNNYSGSGTVTTKEGYYRLGFRTGDLPLQEAVASYTESIVLFAEEIGASVEGLVNLTDEETASYLRQLEKMLSDAIAAISNANTPKEASGLYEEWRSAMTSLVANKARTDNIIHWVDHAGLADYDDLIAAYAGKLSYVSEGELANIRSQLEKAAKEISKSMKAMAVEHDFEEEDTPDSTFYEELEALKSSFKDKWNAAVQQVLLTNVQNRLHAAAKEVKEAIRAMEKQNGVDLSSYIAAVDQQLAEAEKTLSAVDTGDDMYDPDAVATVYETLKSIADTYETEMRGVPTKIDLGDTEQSKTDSPQTGDPTDLPLFIVLIALSGYGSIMTMKRCKFGARGQR